MAKIIGTDTTGTSSRAANFLWHGRYIALADGTISELEIWSASAGDCKVGVYADDGGEPGARLSVNNDGYTCAAGWNMIPLDTVVQLTEGTYYWLSAVSNASGVTSRTSDVGDTRYTTSSYSAGLPDPAGTGLLTSSFDYCARAFAANYLSNALQGGDVRMWHVDDRGEIEVKNGVVTMTGSFETMIYLTLFGGNEDDNKSESTELLQWWGNEGEPPDHQYRSRFQHECSRGRPITSASITVIIEAAENDLKDAFVTTGYADSVEISEVEIVNPKRIRIAGFITLNEGNTESFNLEGDIS